jgi:HD-like signal output (HDOD) protein/ActR/RegA family two-component response regulator
VAEPAPDLPDPERCSRILFVDDEQDLLDGLRDAMRPHRRRWAMTFVTSAEEGLVVLEQEPQEIVVSDLRMPAMDGATFLERVRQRSPSTVRIVLSGHAELRVVARAAGVAHQLLAKPCATEQLARVLERACEITEISGRVALNRRTVGASALPSAPHVYLELTAALAAPDAGIHEIATIVERDIAMAAKVLQLANSAYFGRRNPVKRISDAVAYLGLETLQALVLQTGAFHQFSVEPPIDGFDLDRLQRHCCRVAQLARAIGEQSDEIDGGDAFTAGLLHDIGLLILAAEAREELVAIITRAEREQRPLPAVERELCSVTHAEIGGHLMALWGLPLSVTGAVSRHHDPPPPLAALDERAAVYIANALIEEAEARDTPGAPPAAGLDPELVAAAPWAERLDAWRGLAARQLEQPDY